MSNGVLSTISTKWLIQQAKQHKKRLIAANLIAICATLISVPIPLLMPLMVDEVLLNKPDKGIAFFNQILPESLHQPASYIVMVLIMVILMRMMSQALNIWQSDSSRWCLNPSPAISANSFSTSLAVSA